MLTSRQAAVGGASEAARKLDEPLAPHEGMAMAYKISKAALNCGRPKICGRCLSGRPAQRVSVHRRFYKVGRS